MPGSDSPSQVRPSPALSPARTVELARLIGGLDRLDSLLQLPTDDSEGDVPLGRFRVRRRLGAGRFGVVLLADDPDLSRRVAVKVPQPGVLADPELTARFVREARAAGRLDHQGIVPVFEAGEDGGLVYMAAAYVTGPALSEWLSTHPTPLDPSTAARLVEFLARAVQHAHVQGVLHCDLKPANILLDPTDEPPAGLSGIGTPRITDFGLARLLEDDPSLTRTMQIAGTPLYMSPEQALGDRRGLTGRADVYALGTILYELLIGRPPFPGDSDLHVRERVLTEEPVPPRRTRPSVPRDLEAICLRCLEKDPNRRYGTAAELADDLERFLAGRPVKARHRVMTARVMAWGKRSRTYLLAAVVALGSLALGLTWQRGREPGASNSSVRSPESATAPEATRPSTVGQVDRHRYEADLRAAIHYFEGGDLSQVRSRLDKYAGPDAAGVRCFVWHYLQAQLNRPPLDQWPMHNRIRDFVLAPDGSVAASHDWDGGLKVWEPDTGRIITSTTDTKKPVEVVAFSPDGRRMIVVSKLNEEPILALDLRETATGRTLKTWYDAKQYVTAIRFPRDNLFVAGTKAPHTDEVQYQHWDLDTGIVERVPSRDATYLDVSPNGKHVALGLWSREVRIRSLTTTTVTHIIHCHGGVPLDVRFSPDSRYIAFCTPITHDGKTISASPDRRVIIWDVERDRHHRTLEANTGRTHSIAWSPDGRYLCTVGEDPRALVWDVDRGIRVANSPLAGVGTRVYFTPDSRAILLATNEGAICRWPLDDELNGVEQVKEVWSVAFSPDGSRLLVASDDESNAGLQSVYGFDGSTGRKLHWASAAHAATAMRIACVPATEIAVTASLDNTIRFWNVDDGREIRCVPTPALQGVRRLATSPDGCLIACSGREKIVWLWDTATGEPRGEILPPSPDLEGVNELTFHPSAPYLAVAYWSNRIVVWNVHRRAIHAEYVIPDSPTSLAYSPDGKHLAVSNGVGELRVFDTETHQEVWTTPRGSGLRAVAYSPDGRILATGDMNGDVRLWSPVTGTELLTLRGHRARVNGIAFSPDGRRLVSADHSGRIRFWSASVADAGSSTRDGKQ